MSGAIGYFHLDLAVHTRGLYEEKKISKIIILAYGVTGNCICLWGEEVVGCYMLVISNEIL